MFQHWEKIKVVKSLFFIKIRTSIHFSSEIQFSMETAIKKNRCIFIWGNKIDKISLKKTHFK